MVNGAKNGITVIYSTVLLFPILGFPDLEEGSLRSFEVCFFWLPEFSKVQITVLHKSEFLEWASGNAEDCKH